MDNLPLEVSPAVGMPDFRDLGRPLDAEWATGFENNLLEITDPRLTYRRRMVPGIVYALKRELNSAFYKGILGDVQNVPQIVKGLIEVEEIDESLALQVIAVNVQGFDIKRTQRDEIVDIRASVGDYRCSSYAGYAITGEKYITQGLFDVSRDQRGTARASKAPTHYVTLGTLAGPHELIDRNFLTRLRYSLSSQLELGPIGEVRAVTDHN